MGEALAVVVVPMMVVEVMIGVDEEALALVVNVELVVAVVLVMNVVLIVDVVVEVPATMYMFKRRDPPQYSRGLLIHTIEQPVAPGVDPATRAEPGLMTLPQ